MADIKTFNLPDLGEGLPDATIVEWHVKEGDDIKLDAPLASMETAKAVVDVPSPYTGKVVKLHGAEGDVIETGSPLCDFEPDPNAKQRAESQDTGHSHGPKKKKAADPAPAPAPAPAADDGEREDEGTVVGAMASGNEVRTEQVSSAGGVKAVPAVRAMARKLKVDLSRVRATGEGGVVTLKDVKQAAADGSAPLGAAPVPRRRAGPGRAGTHGQRPAHHRVAGRQADAHRPAQRGRHRPARAAQGRAPQHGPRHGRRPRQRGADHASSTTPTCTPGSASRTSPRA